jgi:hypothetical protein
VNWKKRFKTRRLSLILWKVDVAGHSRIVVQFGSPKICSLILLSVRAKVRPKNWNTIRSGDGIELNHATLCFAIDDSDDLQSAADITNGYAACLGSRRIGFATDEIILTGEKASQELDIERLASGVDARCIQHRRATVSRELREGRS